MTQFSLNVAKFVERAKENGNLVLRKVALDLGTRVVLMSPVDTGRFRGNWQFGLGSANSAVTQDTDKSGAASIARIAAGVETAKIGDVIFLSNNLPYARRLEYGWSKQAPGGMVRVSVAAYQSVIDKAVAGVKQEQT